MSTMHSGRPRVRARAGCPPVLAAETPHNDVVDVTDRTLQRDDSTEATVAELSASRAMRLLDTAIEHLRTVLETSPDTATSARVERAIGDVSRASEDLRQLTDAPGIRA